MDWYKNHFKIFAIVSITLLTLTTGAMYYGQSNYQKIGQAQLLKDGVMTCFQRVTQTFTALMIGQKTSNYLTSGFINTTAECFTEVNKIFTQELSQFKGANQTVNKLISDSHWFHEKVQKIAAMGQGEWNLSSSNIVDKYAQLEQTRDSLTDFLAKRSESAKVVADTGTMAAMAFFFLLFAVAVGYLVSRLKVVRQIDELEKAAEGLNSSKQVFEIEAIISRGMKIAGLSNIRQLFLDSRTALFTQAPEVEIPRVENVAVSSEEQTKTEAVEATPSASMAETLAMVVRGVKDKAFTHGVILDVDVDDDLRVKAQPEGFGQLIYNIVDYAIDASILQNEGRKITVRTKALGDAVYLKCSIANHCFNSTELENFTDSKLNVEQMSLNLTLVQELAADLNAEIRVKNKTGNNGGVQGAEMELIVVRDTAIQSIQGTEETWAEAEYSADEVREEVSPLPTVEEPSRVVSIVRGKKKDLLRRMNSEV